MMCALKNLLKLLGVHYLYQFLHETLFMIPRVIWEDNKLAMWLIWHSIRKAEDEVVLARLRTKTHVLDKGLQVDYWSHGRGAGVYAACVKLLRRLDNSPLKADPSYKWAKEKILEYEAAQELEAVRHRDYVPTHNDPETRQLLEEIIRARRSVRSFLDRPIERDVLETLISVVNWSPVSCNSQPLVLHITQDPEVIRKCTEQCLGYTCFGETVPPCFVAVCTDMRFYSLIDRHLHLVDGALGIENFLLLAHTYGIEGTILNWLHSTGRQKRVLRKLLDIPRHERVIFNMVLGHPSKAAPPPGRKSVERTYKLC